MIDEPDGPRLTCLDAGSKDAVGVDASANGDIAAAGLRSVVKDTAGTDALRERIAALEVGVDASGVGRAGQQPVLSSSVGQRKASGLVIESASLESTRTAGLCESAVLRLRLTQRGGSALVGKGTAGSSGGGRVLSTAVVGETILEAGSIGARSKAAS